MLQIGQTAPDFSLESSSGSTASLKDFIGKKIVLYFYPKDSTPGCTVEACEFRDSKSDFDAKSAVIIGISRDSIKSHLGFIRKHDLNFLLLSDPTGDVCRKYDAWGDKGGGREGIIRTTVIIDEKGKISMIFPNVKVNEHVEKVLAGL